MGDRKASMSGSPRVPLGFRFSGIRFTHNVVQQPPLQSSKHFHHSKVKPLTHETVSLNYSHPHPTHCNHQSAFSPCGFTHSGISYTWNHKLCSLWCLASFTHMMLSRFIYIASVRTSRLNNNPLRVCNTFCLPIYPLMDTWVVSTLWLLWITLSEPLCTKIWIPVFNALWYGPSRGIAMVALTLWGTAQLFKLQFNFNVYPPPS